MKIDIGEGSVRLLRVGLKSGRHTGVGTQSIMELTKRSSLGTSLIAARSPGVRNPFGTLAIITQNVYDNTTFPKSRIAKVPLN